MRKYQLGWLCPFDIPWMCDIEGQTHIARYQLVGNGPVVDAMDRNQAPIDVAIVELVANRLKGADIDHSDAEALGGDFKIGPGLLVEGIQLGKDYILRIVAGDGSYGPKAPNTPSPANRSGMYPAPGRGGTRRDKQNRVLPGIHIQTGKPGSRQAWEPARLRVLTRAKSAVTKFGCADSPATR